jgi:hypothetical protein
MSVNSPLFDGTGMPQKERFRMCEVPPEDTQFFHIMVLLMPSRPLSVLSASLPIDCCVVMAAGREPINRLQHSFGASVSG